MHSFPANGDTQSGYLSASATGTGPGVIVIQEWWGLVDHIKRVADRFAEVGFTAFAPDFYQGRATSEPDEAGSLMMELQIDHAQQVIHGAVSHLLDQGSCSSKAVGVVGFCMGGQLAMLAACEDERVSACVNFYGVHPNIKPEFQKLRAPMMGHFADRDHMTTPEVVAELDATLNSLGKDHRFFRYDADHAFFNDDRELVYDKVAAELAWERSIAFLRDSVR